MNAYKTLVVNPHGDNVKMDITEIGCEVETGLS